MVKLGNDKLRFTVTFAAIFLFVAAAFSTQLVKNSADKNKNAGQPQSTQEVTDSDKPTSENTSAVSEEQNNDGSNSSTASGTCTVTKNGVTQVVPSDSVEVDEHSSGDISVSVDCESNSNSSSDEANNSYSNKSSVKTKINVETNTSN